ncbi:MAG: DUF2892 domain-containing protein [Planctomycetes bacterium]|nr:DUF2892 domain-containing protein [Planctomycetota bacterium]
MSVERALRILAGVMVMGSALLAALHSPWWLVLTGFVGLNLLQSGFTNWCPAVWIFEKLGLERCETVSKPSPGELNDGKA